MKLTNIKLERMNRPKLEKEEILNKLNDIECIKTGVKCKMNLLKDNYKSMLNMIYKDRMNEVQI